MSIIIISSDSRQKGEEIAHKAAGVLSYDCVDRGLLTHVESRYGIPQDKLEWALDALPPSWGPAVGRQRRALACIQATTLSELLKDNRVCHGLGAHLYVLGISHALRVRILAEPNDQSAAESRQQNVSLEKSRAAMERRKKKRRRWSLTHYQLDETDPSHYDLVISLSPIDTEEAVRIITQTVGYRRFTPMTYSLNCLQAAELASRVRADLWDQFPNATVRADGGTVVIETKGGRRNRLKKAAAIKGKVQCMDGVEYVEVHVQNGLFKKAANRLV